jgi:DNA-binding MarR family transcriptional regulator
MAGKRITDAMVLRAIRAYIAREGHSPALSDLGEAVHTTPSNVLRYVRRLERRGLIARARRPGRVRALARSIEVVGAADRGNTR